MVRCVLLLVVVMAVPAIVGCRKHEKAVTSDSKPDADLSPTTILLLREEAVRLKGELGGYRKQLAAEKAAIEQAKAAADKVAVDKTTAAGKKTHSSDTGLKSDNSGAIRGKWQSDRRQGFTLEFANRATISDFPGETQGIGEYGLDDDVLTIVRNGGTNTYRLDRVADAVIILIPVNAGRDIYHFGDLAGRWTRISAPDVVTHTGSNGRANLVGNWQTHRIADNGKRLTIAGQINSDGTERFRVISPDGRTLAQGSGTWELIDDIVHETISNGEWFRNSIRWINDNCYEITVLDCSNRELKGRKSQFHRQ